MCRTNEDIAYELNVTSADFDVQLCQGVEVKFLQ